MAFRQSQKQGCQFSFVDRCEASFGAIHSLRLSAISGQTPVAATRRASDS
jgi:hypothetical protein